MSGHIFLLLYCIGGPVAWAGMLTLFFISRGKMLRLRQKTYPLPENPPHVSVLVPAKDEGAGVRECINRVMQLDYPSFDLTAIDDRSTDDTGTILRDMA